jgi:hypothetical protein
MDTGKIITEPLKNLEFSKDFLQANTRMGFENLADILAENRESLLRKEGFNYRWLAELVEFLSARQLLHLLQPLPESNAY